MPAPRDIDGLEPMREFPVVDRPMSPEEGMRIMTRRLGLSPGKVQALARDRCPGREVRYVRKHLKAFKLQVQCFIRHDVLYTDVLHTGYEELRHLGIGRRYLVNRLLRLVAAGMCDALDSSGEAGDFPPRSWMPPSRAEYVKGVQERVLDVMKREQAGLLRSLKVRMARVSTDVLRDLAGNPRVIRRKVRKASMENLGSGMRKFSDLLIEYRKRLYKTTRVYDIQNRKWLVKSRRNKRYNKSYLSKEFYRAKGLLERTMTDLRKLKDPGVPSFYRRPLDPDWYEGEKSTRRRAMALRAESEFRRRGMSPVPGISGLVSVEDWKALRTDWRISEVMEFNPRSDKKVWQATPLVFE